MNYTFTFQFIDDLLKDIDKEIVFNLSSTESPMKDFQSAGDIIKSLEEKDTAPLSFSEKEELEAKEFFKYNNYYSFTIYRKLLPNIEGKLYSFTDCLVLYKFDNFLRENINKFTGTVELMFRATLVQQLCDYYDGKLHKGEVYLDYEIYNSEKNAKEVLYAFSKRIAASKSDSVIHHRKKRNSSIPFWVIVEEATFGELFHFFSVLKPEYQEYWIAESFKREYRKHFPGWIRAINFMRNSCAHYSRIYGRYFTTSAPKLLTEDRKKAGIKADDNKTLFANMLAIKNVIKFNALVITEWNDFLEDLEVEIEKNRELIKLFRMGFPENWRECLNI